MADHRVGDFDDLMGNAAFVHNFAGQHEERDGHQREVVRPRDEVLRQDLGIERIEVEHQGYTADQ